MYEVILIRYTHVFLGHSQATSPSQERLSLRKVMDYVMDNNDETLRDINRKLHHMLEETLTKNMHLQKVCMKIIYIIPNDLKYLRLNQQILPM